MRYAAGLLPIFAFAGALAIGAHQANAGGLAPMNAYGPGPLTWQGFYIGGNLGAAFDPNDLSIKDLSEEQDLTLNFSNDTEFIGGVHGGYNWQSDSLLIGIEGDIDFADNINFLASVRGRLGWATTNWLVYGTAGVAFIDTDNDFVVVSADDGPFGFSNGNNDTGFVVGGGIDYKVAPRVSIGVEGLFYDFGDDKKTFVAGEDEPFVLKDDLDFAVVRARLTYLFNGGSF
jgi:outer membrane immunogenic protein